MKVEKRSRVAKLYFIGPAAVAEEEGSYQCISFCLAAVQYLLLLNSIKILLIIQNLSGIIIEP